VSGVSRRALFGGAAITGLAAAAGTVALAGGDDDLAPAPPRRPDFHGDHQSGIAMRPAPQALVAAFDCADADRGALAGTLRAVSAELAAVMAGERPGTAEADAPPADNGLLDGAPAPWVTATVSVGASLFDNRYGLAALRPRQLIDMGPLTNDRLDPARTHGDVLLVLQSPEPDACQHALRQVMRRTRGGLVVRWVEHGSLRADPQARRNLLGFHEGTANPPPDDPDRMRELVWVGAGDGEPPWAAGGSYQAVRLIRTFVERWDRAPLAEQESVFGRRKASGAPLDGSGRDDEPRFAEDPQGAVTSLEAHIRRANPRTGTAATRRILRHGFNYSRGVDAAGHLDQGLLFVSYQRRLSHFQEIAARLAGEPLEKYVEPQGGGFFFVLPGAPSGGWLGQSLVEA
jgi:deferrochelatase/peroxidase EfeB